MPYSELLIKGMRDDLTNLGIREARRPEQVEEAVSKSSGTLMIVVNSVCGCAAGKARPGVAQALKHQIVPDQSITVFAGADVEATERAREYMKPYPPSSPSIALFRDGKLVYMLERRHIEGRDANQIASELTAAFDTHCAATMKA